MYEFLYRKLKFKKERFHLFVYISEGLRNGSTIVELLETIKESYGDKNKYIQKYIQKTLYCMEELGDSEAEALYKSSLISLEEKQSIEHIFSSEPYKAMIFLNEKTSNEDNLKWAIGMLFFPTIFILLLYIIFQPELKEMTNEMLAPVNNLSLKKIAVPDWFEDRTMFLSYLTLVLGVMFGLFGFVSYLKKYNIPLLFKIFKIKEREFILNNFEIIQSLLNSGQSLMRSVELLSEQTNDIVAKKIFSEIRSSMQEGDKFMYEVLKKYNIDSATISYIMSGEKNNSVNNAIRSVVNYNRDRYNLLISILSKYLQLAGEIIMTLIILLPLIDIINVTTIGTLNFQV